MGGIWAEENGRFISVDLLPRSRLVQAKDFFQLVSFIAIGLTEQKAVICEKEMRNFRSPPTNGNAIELVVPSCIIDKAREALSTQKK